MDHKEVVRRLTELTSANPDLFTLEKIGESLEGRSLNYVKTGTGPTGVLLWSQMHGDEPTATAALFDIFEYLATPPGGSGGPADSHAADAARRPDAESRTAPSGSSGGTRRASTSTVTRSGFRRPRAAH